MADYNIFSVNELIIEFAYEHQIFPGAVLVVTPESYIHPPPNVSVLDTLIELGSITLSTVRDVINKSSATNPTDVYNELKESYIILDRNTTFMMTFIDFFISRKDNDPYKHVYDKSDIQLINEFFTSLDQDVPSINVDSTVRINEVYNTLRDEIDDEADRFVEIRDVTTQLLNSFKGNFDIHTIPLETSNNISKRDGSVIDQNDIKNLFSGLILDESIPYVMYRDRSGAHYKLHPKRNTVPGKDTTKHNILYIGNDIRIEGKESVIVYKGKLPAYIEANINKLGYILDASYQLSFTIEFEMKNEIINYYLLHDLILTDAYMGAYLYMSDSAYKLGDSSKMKIFYRNPRAILPGLAKQKSDSVVMYVTNNVINGVGGGGFSITIEQISGDFLIEELSTNIKALIQRYFEQKDALLEEYISIFGEEVVNKSVKLTNLGLLKLLKGKFFAGNYSKRCSGQSHQPVYITEFAYNQLPENVKSISAMKFEDPDLGPGGDPNPIWLTCHNNGAYKYIYIPSHDNSPCCKGSEVTINESSPASMKSLSNVKSELKEGKYGHIAGFDKLFASISGDKPFSVRRIGINQRKNSFLECIGYLLYRALKMKTAKEAVGNILNRLINTKYITAFKQCMPEYSDDEIRDYLKNNTFYDSDLVCDGISHVMKVNIFVLDVQEKASIIRIPNYKFMYYRTLYSEWPSIFVYRYEYKRMILYEPVVIAREGKMDMHIFAGLTDEIKKKLESNLISRMVEVSSGDILTDIQFTIEANPKRWLDMIQIIDSYGKLAGVLEDNIPVIYKYRIDPSQGQYISTKDLVLPTHEDVQKSPLSKQYSESTSYQVSRSANNNLEWRSSAYIMEPIPTADVDSEIKLFTPSVVDPIKLGEALRIRSLILQYTAWLFLLSGSTNATKFTEKYVTIDDSVKYEFANGTVFLQQGMKFNDALVYLEPTHLTSNGKIVVPSDQIMFALEYHFELMAKIPGTKHIPSFIIDESTSVVKKNEIIISGEKNLNTYIKQLNPLYGVPVSQITPSMAKLYNPYMIITPDNKIYMIQNVEEIDSKARAINCAVQWYNKKVNTGYNTHSLDAGVFATLLPYIAEYVLDTGLSILPRSEEGVIKILHYGERYAAILDL